MDGNIRLYDGRTLKCVNILSKCHKNKSIHSVEFSKITNKYLLSNGKDNIIRLWDLRNGKQLMEYLGCKQNICNAQARFSYNDEHIISSTDYKNNARIHIYDCNSGERIFKFRDHKLPITYICVSSIEPAFMSCGMDNKVRFYTVMEKANQSYQKNEIIGEMESMYSGTATNMGLTGIAHNDGFIDVGLDSMV